VRRKQPGERVSQQVWLVEVHILGTDQEPWLLLSDWPGSPLVFSMTSASVGTGPRVHLLAKLGGWEPHKDRQPGKITLQRGLGRLLEMLATQAVLSQYVTQKRLLVQSTDHHNLSTRQRSCSS
jgi:hypothetical protein